MLKAMVIATAVILMVSAVEYVRLAWRREIDPVPATWLMFLIFFFLSYWMYWMTPEHSLEGNIGNIAGFLNVIYIFFGVIGYHIRERTLTVAFDLFQRKCLAMGAVIVMFWFATREGDIAYYLTQALALIAYIPMVKRLWTAKKPTEPFFLWGLSLVACLTAIYPAVHEQDKLAWVFLSRAIPSSLLVMFLILRLKRRERKALRPLIQAPATDA